MLWCCTAAALLALIHLLREVLTNIIYEVEVQEILLRFNAFYDLREVNITLLLTLYLIQIRVCRLVVLVLTNLAFLVAMMHVMYIMEWIILVQRWASATEFGRRAVQSLSSAFHILMKHLAYLLHRLQSLLVHF